MWFLDVVGMICIWKPEGHPVLPGNSLSLDSHWETLPTPRGLKQVASLEDGCHSPPLLTLGSATPPLLEAPSHTPPG